MNAAQFFRLVIEEKKKIRSLHLYSDLEDSFAKLLLLHPFTESEVRIYNKLPNNKRLGLLSRKLIKSAKKVGIPHPMIEHYVQCKLRYKHYKGKTYQAAQSFDIDEEIAMAKNVGKAIAYQEKGIQELWVFTRLLLKSVIDKSDIEIKKLSET